VILLYSIKKWKFKVELKTFNADGSKKNIRKQLFFNKEQSGLNPHQIRIIIFIG
jgi:hypothetical protein